MSEILESLERAVIATPSDHTVRLVYADALDESGEPANAARAEFIRVQIEAENSARDAVRLGELSYRGSELFEQNWLAWWSAIAAAAGLPPPFVPGKGIRERIARAVRRQARAANWPYTHTTAETTVHLVEYGLAFRFAGGFPEEVAFSRFDEPESGPALVHRWGDAIPLRRLVLPTGLSVTEWESVDGPHMARLAELTLDSVLDGVAPAVAASPHLANLNRLVVNPFFTQQEAIVALVAQPVWVKLRVLRFAGRLSPDNVRDLAESCTLAHLEILELGLGIPGILGSPVIEAAGSVLRAVIRAMSLPGLGSPRWIEYGPAFEALAAAEWVRRLRVLRINSGHASGLAGLVSERLYAGTETVTDVVPDAAVLALASALDPDKLERLALPAAILGPSVREELTTRLGSKVVFT
jgi:uncharacterized protein (TIGR02996 family)